jgi:hypothetical protein
VPQKRRFTWVPSVFESWSSLRLDMGVVLGFCILVILGGATTLRRRIA